MYQVIAARSAILVEARSNVGPISFGTTALDGFVRVVVHDGNLVVDPVPVAQLSIDLGAMVSGNRLYDAELARRIDVRRFPTGMLELDTLSPIGLDPRYHAAGRLTLHGVTRTISGTVAVTVSSGDELVIEGEQVVDIRDFEIPAPAMLMLRIYPDVQVQMHLSVVRTDGLV